MYVQQGGNRNRNEVRRVGKSSVMTLTSEVLTILDAKARGTVFVARGDDVCLKIIANDSKVARYCNLKSGNSLGDGINSPCWGMPQQGRSTLVFHGVVKPTMEKRE